LHKSEKIQQALTKTLPKQIKYEKEKC